MARARATTQINRRQATNFIEAAEFAGELGLPLNRHVTIAFGHTDLDAPAMDKVFRRIRDDRFKPWLSHRARRDHPASYGRPTFVWAQESAADGAGNAFPHIHWLLHIPVGLEKEFEDAIKLWVTEFAGHVDWTEQVIRIDEAKTPNIFRRYLLKDLPPRLRDRFHIPAKWRGSYGVVYGKRIGISQNLGPAARRRWYERQAQLIKLAEEKRSA